MHAPHAPSARDYTTHVGFSGYIFVRECGQSLGVCTSPQEAQALIRTHRAQAQAKYHALHALMDTGALFFMA